MIVIEKVRRGAFTLPSPAKDRPMGFVPAVANALKDKP